MKSTKRLTTFDEVSREINLLCDAVNKAQNAEGRSSEGKPGDFRVVFDDNRQSYLEAYGKNGWVTTFTGALYDRPMHGRPNPHFPYLEVDNLFAKTYTVAQTTARIGNEVMSSAFGIVESFSNNTITFKDQSNQNLCSFAVNDTCEVRHIKADKSLDIKKINFTVTAVSGRTVTVTYAVGSSLVSVGDIVVQKGNTTNATRQKAIYFSTADNTNVPYIDLYAGTTGYTFGTPKASFGDMTHIADADFNSVAPYLLSGDGIYCTNAYIKGKILMTNQGSIQISGFNNDAGFITASQAAHTFYQATEPTGMVTGDFWFDTSVAGQYKMKRYNGTSWASSPVVSVYMDANGVYAGNITAGQVTTGTLAVGVQNNINTSNLTNGAGWDVTTTALTNGVSLSAGGITLGTDASIKSGMTSYADATNAGYFMGLVTSVPKFRMQTASAANYIDFTGTAFNFYNVNISASTITSGTIQSALTGKRVILGNNRIQFYDASNIDCGYFEGAGGNLSFIPGVGNFGIGGELSASNYKVSTSEVISSARNIHNIVNADITGYMYIGTSLQAGTGTFGVNATGQLIKVNNIAATAKYTLIGDGTSFTPRLLAMSDLPALTANRVLLSDASGYVAASSVSNTTLGYLDATSSVQTQLNSKASLTADNTLSGENSFAKLKFNAEVSHSVTGSGNYSCLDKNVIILTPNANGYTVCLTN